MVLKVRKISSGAISWGDKVMGIFCRDNQMKSIKNPKKPISLGLPPYSSNHELKEENVELQVCKWMKK